MEQSSAVWLVILLALVTANVPFALQRPLLALPWAQPGEPRRPMVLRWLESLVFLGLLGGTGFVFFRLISDALVLGDAASIALFALKITAYIVLCGLIMAYPGWRARGHEVQKSFLVRLIEVLVLYGLCGTLAMALEDNLGNRFEQTWEFYAITGSLYVVLGYPGFVLRYLMRRRRRTPARSSKTAAARQGSSQGPVKNLPETS